MHLKRHSRSVLIGLFSALLPFCGLNQLNAQDDEKGAASHPLIAEGFSFLESGQTDKAMAAFDKVLEQDASDLPARLGQAMIFAEQQRHAEAFSAYDMIVKSHPTHAFAWNGRGLAAFNLEDFDEALSSFEKATADYPVNGFFYESLAWTHMCRGEFTEALSSAKQATLMYDQKGESSAYPLLIAYFSSMESGDRVEARRTLAYALKNRPADQSWPAPVFDYLAQRMDAYELISYVSDTAEETEAHTYIGLNLRARGDEAGASRHLNWVARHGDQRVFEHTLARALQPEKKVAALMH